MIFIGLGSLGLGPNAGLASVIVLALSPELPLSIRIVLVPCGSQLAIWAIQHTWSTGTAEVVTRAGKFAKASDKCYTQQKGIVPLQRALISC